MIRLTERKIRIKVFYTWEQAGSGNVYDAGFGRNIQWDIPLLEGYEHEFVDNIARSPGVHHFRGIINPDLIERIESWAPDGLLVIGWNYHSHLRVMRHFHGKVPIYFRGDSVLLHERWVWRKLIRRLFLTWVYRHVDYALYVGSNNKSYYLRYGLSPQQLLFSPQAVDIERFQEPAVLYDQQARQQRDALKIPDGHLTVLYAGKLTKVKNPGFVLDLAEACEGLPISFIIVGDGMLKKKLQMRASGKANVHFMHFQNQRIMPAIYRVGDIFIMPSLKETWGMAINEAMASGKPVMASDKVGCATDLVLEDKTGIVFKVGDIEKCVQFLRKACADRKMVTEMGQNAATLIQFFSFSHIVDSLERVIEL